MTNLTFDPDNTLSGGLYSLSPREVIELGIDLCAAVESSFGADGCHGGIWPGNVSIADGRVLLGPTNTLGVKEMDPDALEYIAPEQFWSGENSPAADVYSIGLILYTALNGGLMPFFAEGESGAEARAAALQNRMRGKTVPYPRRAGRELGDVVLRAIAFHRDDRYASPAELRQALQALPEGAAVPAAVPVLPLTSEEVKSARSYKVDKEFEKSEPPKPKKEKKPDPEKQRRDEEREQREAENFRKPKKRRTWIVPVIAVVVIAAAAVLILRGCKASKDPATLPVNDENTPVVDATPEPVNTPEPTPTPIVTPEPTPEPTPTPAAELTYQVVIEDVTWEEAVSRCEALGGHLATIRSDAELADVIAAVEESGARFIWLGASRGSDGAWYYVTGEPMDYAVWDTNEPSAFDGDGTPENCLLMWRSSSRNIWCFNDTRNDPISVLPRTYSGKTAYVCQFDQ